MGKNAYIINPKTGTPIFGHVQQLIIGKKNKTIFLGGPIYLRRGQHVGPNKGFGALHIVAEHLDDLRRLGYCEPESEEAVDEFVSDINNVEAVAAIP